ncbi:MAG TPA: ATP-binding protein [Longimicrobium sp.]|nr:ATP-binding protein [Longimicrobium sp.]
MVTLAGGARVRDGHPPDEGRLRAVIEHLADGVVIVGRDGRVRFANPAAEALFGLGAEELVGSELGLPLVAGETAQIDVVRRGRGPGAAELRVVEMTWEGEPALLVSLRDVTDRAEAEAQRLRAEREAAGRHEAEAVARRARFLSQVSAALAASLDPRATLERLAQLAVPELADWCVIDLARHDRGLERVAHAHAEPAKRAVLERLRAEYPPRAGMPTPASEAVRTGRPLLYAPLDDETLHRLTRDPAHAGLIRELGTASLICVPLVARGQTLGAVTFGCGESDYDESDLALARDFAQRAALAVSNARLYDDAQQASRAKSEFLAVMSHELRTPLNAILGYTDLMQAGIGGRLSPAHAEHLSRVEANARHLLDIVEEILSFSRVEAGAERVRLEQVDLRSVVRDVGRMMEPLVRGKHLGFDVSVPGEPAPVRTDAAKVRQVLANLVSNAIKFTDQGAIRMEAQRDGTHHMIRVRDTGIGIAPEHAQRIFEPFWQVEQSNRRVVGGTGLGLSVARDLAELLGGSLTVESTPGQGSTFTLALPADD